VNVARQERERMINEAQKRVNQQVPRARGEALQIPIYLLALERVFGVRALGAGFAALGTRKRTGVIGARLERELAAAGAPPGDGPEEAEREGRVRLERLPLEGVLRRSEDHIRRYVTGIAAGFVEPLPREPADCERCDVRAKYRPQFAKSNEEGWAALFVAKAPSAVMGRQVAEIRMRFLKELSTRSAHGADGPGGPSGLRQSLQCFGQQFAHLQDRRCHL